MPRDVRFWRNAAIVTVAHLGLLIALARGSRESRSANSSSIVWMNAGATESPASNFSASATEQDATPQRSPTPAKADESPVPTAPRSEIQLPSPTPVARPTLKPSVTPRPTPKSSPKPTAKPTPKPTASARTTPKPSPKKPATPAEKKNDKPKDEANVSVTKRPSDSASDSTADKPGADGTTGARNAEFAWYGTMLHDRFHREWDQPKTVVATGTKMSAVVKIRIEKDGRVSRFTIVKPSGNVAVDESVAAVEKRVTRVDALPNGLTPGGYYEVQIIFELNPEQ
jgi:TonB family protein